MNPANNFKCSRSFLLIRFSPQPRKQKKKNSELLKIGNVLGKEEHDVVLPVVPHVVDKPRDQADVADLVPARIVDPVDGDLARVFGVPAVRHRHPTDGTLPLLLVVQALAMSDELRLSSLTPVLRAAHRACTAEISDEIKGTVASVFSQQSLFRRRRTVTTTATTTTTTTAKQQL